MSEEITDEQRKATISALLREKSGYEARGESVDAVNAELKRLGHGKAPAKRAQTRKKD